MSTAVIPARAGSGELPDKNTLPVGGIPMVVRAINACRKAGIERILVSTDSEKVMRMALDSGAVLVGRPKMLAGPRIGVDVAVRHALSVYPSLLDNTTLVIQPNLPLWQDDIIQRVRDQMAKGLWTAVASAVAVSQRPEWMKMDVDGFAEPYLQEPAAVCRQSMVPLYYLDGQVIAVETDVLMAAAESEPKAHHWMGDRIGMVVRPEVYALEVHTQHDLDVAERLVEKEARNG